MGLLVTTVQVAAIVGGLSIEKQARLLKATPEVVVATPGRLWELISTGEHHFTRARQNLSFLVIDEVRQRFYHWSTHHNLECFRSLSVRSHALVDVPFK